MQTDSIIGIEGSDRRNQVIEHVAAGNSRLLLDLLLGGLITIAERDSIVAAAAA